MTYEALFVNAAGRTSRGQFAGALVPLLAAAAFYFLVVPDMLARWNLPVLLFPTFVLHARRLRDMGRSSWLLLAPAGLIGAAVWLRSAAPGTGIASNATLAAVALAVVFAVWGLLGKSRTDGSRLGELAGI